MRWQGEPRNLTLLSRRQRLGRLVAPWSFEALGRRVIEDRLACWWRDFADQCSLILADHQHGKSIDLIELIRVERNVVESPAEISVSILIEASFAIPTAAIDFDIDLRQWLVG